MGGVRRVGPVHASRDDDVDRRRLRLHRAHLHRRGVRPQQDVLGEVEGVLRRPRGVLRRVVERGEVVVLVVDLGALDDRESEPDEDVLHLAPDLRDEVQAAAGLRRVAGERDVDAVLGEAAVELGRLELGGPLGEQALERHAHLVGRLADGPALLGRQLADRAERRRELGLAAEVAHTQLLELLPCCPPRVWRSRLRSGAGPGQPSRGHPICHLVERHGRRHGDVQRVRRGRESAQRRHLPAEPRVQTPAPIPAASLPPCHAVPAPPLHRGRPCGH